MTDPSRRRRSALPAVVAPAALLLALAGCAVAAAPTPTASGAAPSASASASGSASPSPTVDPDAPAGQCADAALRITVTPDPGGSSAGHEHWDVVFTNTGSTACALLGYPGVSVVATDGTQLGKAAARGSAAPVLRQLAPGASVFAALEKVDLGDTGGPLSNCSVELGSGWAVYAPHSFAKVVVPSSDPIPACGTGPVFMTLTAPVAPGTHS